MEKVSPTRMNLLKIKDRAVLARNGLELMRNKRAALVREILRVKDSVLEHRGRLRNAMQGAMNSLTVALGLDDRPAVESAAMAARRDLPVELTEKNVWGVRFPEIDYHGVVRAPDARNYSLSSVSSHTGSAARDFERVLDVALRIASVEVRLKKIGAEIKKTTRRVNAVTEILLPRFEEQIRECRFALDEREREEVFRVKRFKKHRL